jgi:hypothetical protein
MIAYLCSIPRACIKLGVRDVSHVVQGVAVGTLIVSSFSRPVHIEPHGVILFWASLIFGGYLVRLSGKL